MLVQLKGDFELIQETLEDFSNGPGLAHHYKEWAASQAAQAGTLCWQGRLHVRAEVLGLQN